MTHELIELLERIDPAHTIEDIHRRADEAVNSFPQHTARITEWPEFRRTVLEFCMHVEAAILGLGQPVSGGHEFDWGRFHPVLSRAFGPNGEKAAFEMARTGAEGGLYRVLRTLARVLAERYAQDGVAGLVYEYWNSLPVPQQLAVVDAYLDRFGYLLPPEMLEGGAARLRANFPKVLEEHPKLLQRLRTIGRQ